MTVFRPKLHENDFPHIIIAVLITSGRGSTEIEIPQTKPGQKLVYNTKFTKIFPILKVINELELPF